MIGINTRKPVPPQYLDKLWLGWNIGLADLPVLGRSRPATQLMYRMPWHRYSSKVVPPSLHQRGIDVLYRVSRATGSIDTFRFQRIEMREQLELLRTGHPTYVYHMDGKVPKKIYDQEMSKAVIIPSPFGDGEMCYRDFEAIRAGGVMLKADMGHLDMRPNFYAPGVTYVPHAWDFSDFPEKVLHILEHRADYEGLARSAQETYLRALSPQGGEAFALHVREIAQEALARRQVH
ncbi:MAG: hypothetical protein IPK19_23345 [Chloroflexi bacterium]|nr:hypothetical protein [Chloroflexota bacterium]